MWICFEHEKNLGELIYCMINDWNGQCWPVHIYLMFCVYARSMFAFSNRKRNIFGGSSVVFRCMRARY